MISEINQNKAKQYTYCPECGLVLEMKESEDVNSVELCIKCFSRHRPRF